jgi:hypothetical protein
MSCIYEFGKGSKGDEKEPLRCCIGCPLSLASTKLPKYSDKEDLSNAR